MKYGSLARRYAKAAFDLSVNRGELQSLDQQLTLAAEIWEKTPALREVFRNPQYDAKARQSTIEFWVKNLGSSELLKHIFQLLANKGRMNILPDFAEAFRGKTEEAEGKIRAQVISATPLSPEYITQLEHTLNLVTGKNVSIEHRQDPSLIAGIVTKVGDQILDGSAKTRLMDIKEELLRSQQALASDAS